jgi:hypothetical protein
VALSINGVSSPLIARRARSAALARWRADNDPELIDAKRELGVAVLKKQISDVLARAQLTAKQRAELAELLGAR